VTTLPLEPLRRAVANGRDVTMGELADLLEASRDAVFRWRRDGMTLRSAETFAERAGFHPIEVWPNYYEVSAAAEETEALRWLRDQLDRAGDNCIVWPFGQFGGARHRVGGLYVDGRRIPAHRYAWEQVHDLLPDGAKLKHLCGEAMCCNPRHLAVIERKVA
jgi:PAS domain-containing protein